MEKLKVGDNVVKIGDHLSHTSYHFDVVERLTPTLAVTKRGVKIKNEPKSTFGEGFVFKEHGERWKEWQLSTSEIVSAALKQKKEIEARAWLREKKFTTDEVVRLKEMFEAEFGCNAQLQLDNQ